MIFVRIETYTIDLGSNSKCNNANNEKLPFH